MRSTHTILIIILIIIMVKKEEEEMTYFLLHLLSWNSNTGFGINTEDTFLALYLICLILCIFMFFNVSSSSDLFYIVSCGDYGTMRMLANFDAFNTTLR